MAHVFVVDDDPNVCSSFEKTLQRAGHRVSYAYHAAEAWRAMHANRPELLIVDLGLPDVHGWEFARRVNASDRLRGIPIIAMSKHPGVLDQVQARMHGTKALLTKPVPRYTLEEAVEKALS